MAYRVRSSAGPRVLIEFLEARELLSAMRSPVIPLTARQAAIAAILTESIKSASALAPVKPGGDTSQAHITLAFGPTINGVRPHSSAPPGGAYVPAQMLAAYGYNSVTFGGAQGDGSGQTIAIIDAYDDPGAFADLQAFDQQFGIPDPPSFERVNQQGQTGNYPGTDPAGPGSPTGTWEEEESLDIEWAHAIAPGANIILVETNSPDWTDLIKGGVAWARSQPQVSVISMSWGGQENGSLNETSYDSYFTTPAGHQGITFVASTGDDGAPGGYPAYSPNVVAVGGTTLNIVNNAYSTETTWSESGGGISQYEAQPAFQTGVVTQSATKRTEPDVAMDANPSTGVAIVDSWDFGASPWLTIGGTSLAGPMFAATIAITDQGRELIGKGTLDGPSQTLPMLYSAGTANFHDIVSGQGNGGNQNPGPGYDLVTGIGSPVANALIPDLVGVISSISGTVFLDNNLDGVFDAGDAAIPGVTVYLDANNNGVLDGPITQSQTSGTLSTVVNTRSSATLTLATTALATAITDVTVSLSIQHGHDSDLSAYLIAPDGTQITLFSGIGGSGANFTDTSLDDSASTFIGNGTAPFTGTYSPANPLALFDGHGATGNWRLKVTNAGSFRNGSTATITGWSITITTAAEKSTLTASDGTFSFPDIPSGNYTVQEIAPAGYAAQSSNGYGVSVLGATTVDIGDTLLHPPTTFTTTGADPVLYVGVDPSDPTLVDVSGNADGSNPAYLLALASLPSLTFDLFAPESTLVLDYSNGSPVPAGGILVDGGGIFGNQLVLIGGAQTFSLDDYQLAAGADAGAVHFQNLSVIALTNAAINYGGSFSTVDEVIAGQDTLFEFD